MSDIEAKLAAMRRSPKSVKFRDAVKVAEHFFGEGRVSGSHHIFSMPWPGDPRVNLQNSGGKAKAYQVRQLLEAVERIRLTEGRGGAEERERSEDDD